MQVVLFCTIYLWVAVEENSFRIYFLVKEAQYIMSLILKTENPSTENFVHSWKCKSKGSSIRYHNCTEAME